MRIRAWEIFFSFRGVHVSAWVWKADELLPAESALKWGMAQLKSQTITLAVRYESSETGRFKIR